MEHITVVGVGQREGELTERACRALESGARVILHTEKCPCAEWLRAKGIDFLALDGLYEADADFDSHAVAAAASVLEAARDEAVVFAVMDVRDRSVAALLEQAQVELIPGPPAEDALFARAVGATQLLEASDWENYSLQAAQNALIREIDSRELASEVKLRLMECYPEESEVFVRLPEGGVARTKLYNLDRLQRYDHRASAFVPACGDLTNQERWGLNDVARLAARLRGPDGCPWDRAQTHESLRDALIEEAYEVADAIDRNDEAALIEELGDVLFDVALHAQIAREHGAFTVEDASSAVVEKMIGRHPHVFSGRETTDAQAVEDGWEEIKKREYGFSSPAEAMAAVAHALPALKRAEKVLKRADDPELVASLAGTTPEMDAEALGDALLRLCAGAFQAGIHPEAALTGAIERLIDRVAAKEGPLCNKST